MRRLIPAVFLSATLLSMTGCENVETPDFFEPSFGKVPRGCVLSDTQEGVIQLIRDGIDLLFDERQAKKAANGHIDNILREVCAEDYEAARRHLHSFIQQVEGQPEEKLTEYREDWANLVNWAIILATDPATITISIPPGAFEATGSLGILDPANYILWTANGEAAVLTDQAGSYEPFIMAISRVPDGMVPGLFGNTWRTAPPGYQIVAENAFPPGGAVVAVCLYESFLSKYLDLPEDVMEWELPLILARLILAHGGDSGVGLLPVEDPPDGFFCPADPTVYPGTESLASAPGWVQSIGRFAGSLAIKAFGLEPLHARRFAGRGLAGRTTSFSPFAPVDPFSLILTVPAWPGPSPGTIFDGDEVQMVATLKVEPPAVPPEAPSFGWRSSDETVAIVSEDGLVTGVGPGSAEITVSYPGLRQSLSVTILPKSGDLIVDLNIAELSGDVPAPEAGSIPEIGWMVQLYDGGVPVGSPMPTGDNGTVLFESLDFGDYTLRVLNRDFDVSFPSAPDMTWSVQHSHSNPSNTFPIDGVQEALREGVRIHRIGDPDNPGNGNAYEYVSGGRSWVAAFNQVLETDLLGVPGHLVTIMTEAENKFVSDFFSLSPDLCLGTEPSSCDFMAWVGLSDRAVEGTFLWVTGEELGVFRPWGTVPDPNDPDESNEDYVEINSSGLWSTVNGASSTNDGYFVEFDVPPPSGM